MSDGDRVEETMRLASGAEPATCPKCKRGTVLAATLVTGILHRSLKTATPYGTPTIGIVTHDAWCSCNWPYCDWVGRVSELKDVGENQN